MAHILANHIELTHNKMIPFVVSLSNHHSPSTSSGRTGFVIILSTVSYTKALGNGLFELRLKGSEGIARVFYCTLVNRHIMMLHSFVKKTQKTPLRELRIAESRLKEIKNANT